MDSEHSFEVDEEFKRCREFKRRTKQLNEVV
jgi:hypothetical protein